jgi:hypothetical protein
VARRAVLEESTVSVCEHGDHPAPEGKRFCSPECEECEHTDFDHDPCAGICYASVLLVGEDNPYTPGEAGRELAFYPYPRGASGDRLRRVFGLTDVDYLRFSRTNLCAGRWDNHKARLWARLIAAEGWSVIVLCGAKVHRAFDLGDPGSLPQVFVLEESPRTTVVELPHPSGRSRSWNQRDMVARVRRALRRVLPGVPWGSADDALPEVRP